MARLNVNGTERDVPLGEDTPLLWALRDALDLTGTKFGCGVAACGACTVLVDGQAIRSCVYPLAATGGKPVHTIEGAAARKPYAAVREAWIAEQVPQCGYCPSGQIMKAAELLAQNKAPSRDDIVTHMNGNICRCGTYTRIVAAIQRAAQEG